MKKQTKKSVALVAAGVAVSVIAFSGASAMLKKDEDKTLNAFNYECGNLDDVTGKFDDEEIGIVTKKYYKFEELKSIDIDGDVVVYVNAYDEDKTFIQADEYTEDLTEEEIASYSALGGVYFKLEIVDPDDDEISFLEVNKLQEKVTVTLTEAEEEAEEEKSEAA